MNLTKDLIQSTIKLARCCHASMVWKYYRNLALGINKECLYSNIKLLRAYINILKGFNIIDEYSECECCLDGEYDVILDNDSIYSFQFLEDGTGTLVNNTLGGNFSFDWSQDCNTDNIYLNFPDVFETTYEAVTTLTVDNFVANVATFIGYGVTTVFSEPAGFLTLDDLITSFNNNNNGFFLEINNEGFVAVKSYNSIILGEVVSICMDDSCPSGEFIEVQGDPLFLTLSNVTYFNNCDFTYTGNIPWYEEANLDITGTAQPFEDSLFTINVKDPYGLVIYTLDLPITTTKEELVEYWNSTTPYNNILMSNVGNELFFYTNFGEYYTDYSVEYSQYEGGTDSVSSNFINSANFIGEGYTEVSVNGSTIYSTLNSFDTLADFIENFNDNNTLGITAFSENPINLTLNSPQYSFTSYNGIETEILTNKGTAPTDETSNYSGGVNGTLSTCTINGVNPLDFLNSSGLLTVTLDGEVIFSSTQIFTSFESFVVRFNTYNTGGITVSYDTFTLTFSAPGTQYADYNETPLNIASYKNGFNEYNDVYTGGIDPIDAINDFVISSDTFIGFGNIFISLNGNLIYSTDQPFTNINEFIEDFNNNNTLEITVSSDGVDTLTFTSPNFSGAKYNEDPLNILSYKNTLISYDNTYSEGVDPTIQTYTDDFVTNNSEQTFETLNPCTPTLNTLKCLTNEQVMSIIDNINKICKSC